MGDEDWSVHPRTDIVVRRTHLIKDAVKEAKKNRFDSSKLICVSIMVAETFQYVFLILISMYYRLNLLEKLELIQGGQVGSFGAC